MWVIVMKRIFMVLMTIFVTTCLSLCLGTTAAALVEENPNVDFSYDDTTFIKDINNRSLSIYVNDEEQTFAVKKQDITYFKVTSQKYSSKNSVMTVKSAIVINRDIASIKTYATLKYKLTNDEWKLKSVSFSKPSIYRIYLKGSFTGKYKANQGETKVTFIIKNVTKDGFATGTMNFGPLPTNPSVPTGSYKIKGGYDTETGKITFVAGEWIEHPKGYNTLDFYGSIDLENRGIKGDHFLMVYPD